MTQQSPSVSIKELSLNYGSVSVLKELNIDVADGEFLVLLGPSGCGKSTLLNCIAGLLEISDGQIFIKDKNVTWKEPKDRGIGDELLRDRAVRQCLELEIMVVPAENISGLAVGGMRRLKPLAEIRPAGRVRGALLDGQMRAIDGFHAQRSGNVEHLVRLVFQEVDTEMA